MAQFSLNWGARRAILQPPQRSESRRLAPGGTTEGRGFAPAFSVSGGLSLVAVTFPYHIGLTPFLRFGAGTQYVPLTTPSTAVCEFGGLLSALMLGGRKGSDLAADFWRG